MRSFGLSLQRGGEGRILEEFGATFAKASLRVCKKTGMGEKMPSLHGKYLDTLRNFEMPEGYVNETCLYLGNFFSWNTRVIEKCSYPGQPCMSIITLHCLVSIVHCIVNIFIILIELIWVSKQTVIFPKSARMPFAAAVPSHRCIQNTCSTRCKYSVDCQMGMRSTLGHGRLPNGFTQ